MKNKKVRVCECDTCYHNQGNDICERQNFKDSLNESGVDTKEFGKGKPCPFTTQIKNSDVLDYI